MPSCRVSEMCEKTVQRPRFTIVSSVYYGRQEIAQFSTILICKILLTQPVPQAGLNTPPAGVYSNQEYTPAGGGIQTRFRDRLRTQKNNDLLSDTNVKVCDAKFCSRNIGKNAFSQAVSLNVRDPARRHLLGYFEAILLLRTLRYNDLHGSSKGPVHRASRTQTGM